MPVQFKKDPYLIAFALFIVISGVVLVAKGAVTWKEAITVVSAALLSPGLLGRKDD